MTRQVHLVGTAMLAAFAGAAAAGPLQIFAESEPVELTEDGAPTQFRVVDVNVTALRSELAVAPMELSGLERVAPAFIELPHPDGGTATFRVVESPVIAPELRDLLPDHSSYLVYGVDDPGATGRVALAGDRVSARIISPAGSWHVDQFEGVHASYHAKYAPVEPFSCGTVGQAVEFDTGPAPELNRLLDGNIRVLRHAIATTGEYTSAQGGASSMLSLLTIYVSAANAVLEPNVGVRLELVANNSNVVFTNRNTDPYTNGNASQMLSVNDSVLDTNIGSANYDIGHVFGTGGGGVATLANACSGTKGQGVTLASSTNFNSRLATYLHEVGHQLNAGHTWNGVNGGCGATQWSPTDAFEPGSGSSIMSYAGLCSSDNLQIGAINDQYHSRSIATMGNLIDNVSCGTLIPTGNSAPTLEPLTDATIPVNTPFELTAVAQDPDDDALLYSWEQRDRGPRVTLASGDNGDSPLFTMRRATNDPTRVFPRIEVLRGTASDNGERLPQVPRTMVMRIQVRDGMGNSATERKTINVVSGVGPFNILSPLGSSVIDGPFEVVWTPNGTDGPPTNTQNVDIFISTDNGNTFTQIEDDVPNDGSHIINIGPEFNTTQGRIKVKAANSVYFALSTGTFDVNVTDLSCNPADLAEPFGELTFGDISTFLAAFNAQDSAADLASPFGEFTFGDISAFLAAFTAGCP